jgi:hypothetical protein
MERRTISGSLDTVFEFDYSVRAEDMRSLYEKAKRDQWNASRDIAWDTPATDDGRVLADELIDIHGSPLWDRLGEADRVELNRRVTAWRLSVLLYGEQGAMLACSQLVNIVTGADEKFFQATQVVDEARHNEVLERYIQTRLGGLHYPMPENERFLFDAILTDPRWYIKTIALQLVAETFAVSMFRMMGQAATDPVLREVCGRILQDESRHMGFGMLSLPAIVEAASETERREMEDFTCLALEKVLTGFFPREPYEDIGFSRAQIDEVRAYRRDAASRNDYAVYRKFFRRDMHAAMVQNLVRIGLLTDRVRPRLAELGIALPAAVSS